MSLPKEQLQAFLVRGYYDLPMARHYMVRFKKKTTVRSFIRRHLDLSNWHWTSLYEWDKVGGLDVAFHIGFTMGGMRHLVDDLPVEYLFRSFPSYCKGPVFRARKKKPVYGDPKEWEKVFRNEKTHAVITVYAKDGFDIEALDQKILKELRAHGFDILNEKKVWREGFMLKGSKDQFLYREPISQPTAESDDVPARYPSTQPPAPDWTMFLKDDSQATYNLEPFVDKSRNKRARTLLCNGGFSAFEVLKMKALDFNRYLIEAAHSSGLGMELIAAKMCGRWRNGTPLMLSPTEEKEIPEEELNNFNYNPDDMSGLVCPPGSHIRRNNARGSLIAGSVDVHRIMRQSTAYGKAFDPVKPVEADRGLVGHFLGASIEHQFEFIMEQWVNTGTFTGYPANEKDPLLGAQTKGPTDNFTIYDGDQVNYSFRTLPRFVIPQGGCYLFFPSMKALKVLSKT